MKKIILIFAMALLISGCKQLVSPNTTSAPLKGLSGVPIRMGEQSFNEGNNTGFTNDYKVTWKSNNFYLSSNGNIQGTIETNYGGPRFDYQTLNDVLFLEVVGVVYADESNKQPSQIKNGNAVIDYPQILNEPSDALMSEPINIIAQKSDANRATFEINDRFKEPDIRRGNGVLRYVDVRLTWVRVYKDRDGKIYYQVFPGRPLGKYASLQLDQKATDIKNNFGYYTLLLATEAAGNPGTNYREWIAENITK